MLDSRSALRDCLEGVSLVTKSLEPLSVAILAGGMSRRMGQDKAMLRIGDRTLIEIVAQRVSVVATELFVVSSNGKRFADLGFRVVPDVLPNAGSLGGVYSALRWAQFDYCLVVACDMPLINLDLLTHMAGLPRDYDVAIPSLDAERSDQGGDETLETLHAIYATRLMTLIESHIQTGHLKIADVLRDINVRRITGQELRRHDPDLRSFFNVNTADDFAFARDLIERSGSGAGGAQR